MFQSKSILALHKSTVAQWHQSPVENTGEGLMSIVCQQHAFNYNLWHEEDIARSRDVTDAQIAQVKRNIDQLNQNRNDWIEKIDDAISDYLDSISINAFPDAPINTETPGSVVDRLSIIAIRIYHLEEQLERTDVDQKHTDSVKQKIAICKLQRDELATALDQLMDSFQSGTKRHRTYRQFKMYNDPALNPYLYAKRAA